MVEKLRPGFEEWAVVSLFGHHRLGFVRVEVPESDGTSTTHLFGPAAIYSIDVVTEPVARAVAERSTHRPAQAWDVHHLLTPELVDRWLVERAKEPVMGTRTSGVAAEFLGPVDEDDPF